MVANRVSPLVKSGKDENMMFELEQWRRLGLDPEDYLWCLTDWREMQEVRLALARDLSDLQVAEMNKVNGWVAKRSLRTKFELERLVVEMEEIAAVKKVVRKTVRNIQPGDVKE